jgi:hypothetical protein
MDGVTALSLRPLGQAHSRALLSGLLSAGGLPTAIEQTIIATADGNPLFIEEILTRLIEAGSLTTRDGLWEAPGGAATVEIPDTIQAVLAARIDSLPPDQKRIIQEASVVGRIFWERPVELAIGTPDVVAGLSALESRGLVALRPTSSLAGQSEYGFKHALVRDVAYASLPIARRARAHAAVGQWLADLSPDRPDELAELVAFHYAAAVGEGSDLAWSDDPDEAREVRHRAFNALMTGGAAARRSSGLALALGLHETAARLAETDVERARAEEEIGDDHDAAYHGEQAVPAWDRALQLRRAMPDSNADIARLCFKAAYMGAVRWGGFRSPMDPATIDRYVDDGLVAVQDEELEARLQVLRGASGNRWAAMHQLDPRPVAERLAAVEIGRRYAERANLANLEAVALDTVAPLLIASGDLEGALEAKRRQVAVAARIDGIRERQFELFEGANTLVWMAGEASPMLEPLLLAHRLGQDLSPHEILHSTFGVMAALFHLGRWDELLGYLDEHVRTFEVDDQSVCPFRPGGLALGAIVLADRGDRAGAAELIGRIPQTRAPVGLVDGLKAMAENAIGDPAAARNTAEHVLASGGRNFAEEPAVEIVALLDALAELEDHDALAGFLFEARRSAGQVALIGPTADRAEGRSAAASGDVEHARTLLRKSIEGFDGLSVFETARTREVLARLDDDASFELLSQALAAYEALGAEPHAARARDAIAALSGQSAREAGKRATGKTVLG